MLAYLSFYKQSFNGHMDVMKEYVSTVETSLRQQLEKFTKDVDATIETMSKEEGEEYGEFMSDSHWMLAEVFPQMSRRAQLIVMYSFFEHSLHSFCKCLHNIGLTSHPPPKKNFYVREAKKYLHEDAHIPNRVFGKAWNRVDKLRLIRNAITHNDGRLSKDGDRRKLKLFIARESSISLQQFDEIVFTKELCPCFLNLVREVFRALVKEVDRKTKLNKNAALWAKAS